MDTLWKKVQKISTSLVEYQWGCKYFAYRTGYSWWILLFISPKFTKYFYYQRWFFFTLEVTNEKIEKCLVPTRTNFPLKSYLHQNSYTTHSIVEILITERKKYCCEITRSLAPLRIWKTVIKSKFLELLIFIFLKLGFITAKNPFFYYIAKQNTYL